MKAPEVTTQKLFFFVLRAIINATIQSAFLDREKTRAKIEMWSETTNVADQWPDMSPPWFILLLRFQLWRKERNPPRCRWIWDSVKEKEGDLSKGTISNLMSLGGSLLKLNKIHAWLGGLVSERDPLETKCHIGFCWDLRRRAQRLLFTYWD